MFVHEIPFMSPTSQDEIHAGNVMTVEPGIYIPGWGGIRIEDQILITETGNENLTASVVKKPEEIEALMAAARKQ